MKKILLALTVFGGMSYTAGAQDSKFAKNYKVCRDESGYIVCPDQSTTNLNDPAPKYIRGNQVPPWQQTTFISPLNTRETQDMERIPTRKALDNAYPVKNEEMEKNNRRNLNAGKEVYLSPSTGEIR